MVLNNDGEVNRTIIFFRLIQQLTFLLSFFQFWISFDEFKNHFDLLEICYLTSRSVPDPSVPFPSVPLPLSYFRSIPSTYQPEKTDFSSVKFSELKKRCEDEVRVPMQVQVRVPVPVQANSLPVRVPADNEDWPKSLKEILPFLCLLMCLMLFAFMFLSVYGHYLYKSKN